MASPDSTKERAAAVEAKCPVDHRTRETWLQHARAAPGQKKEGEGEDEGAPSPARQAKPGPGPGPGPGSAPTASSWWSWSSWPNTLFSWAQPPGPAPAPAPARARAAPRPPRPHGEEELGTSRVTSSIPRSSAWGVAPPAPSNHEQETGASASGHWVYPSEKMFFEALRRKGFDASAAAAARDMRTVVPMHNAVNERAWAEIVEWERPYAAPCGGPRLLSFAGRGRDDMTPRARLNALLGYTAPFDRHDWVVDRCGTRVEYVIDFYAGRPDAQGTGKPSFYLDVRPKLNTWEGVKMRALRATGLA